jgi:hypothetical protein
MVKKHGAKHGMGDLAQHIDERGRVDNRAIRKEILAMRKDPDKASALAAELANENKAFLEDRWGGAVGDTELYFAHFLGAGGAVEFLKARDQNPLQKAAVIFPEAARSNRNVFYDARTGKARTLDEVYAFFDRKFDINDPIPENARGGLEGPSEAPPARGRATEIPYAARARQMDALVFVDGLRDGGEMLMPRMKPAVPGLGRDENAPVRMAGQGFGYGNLVVNPVELMMISQLAMPGENTPRYND